MPTVVVLQDRRGKVAGSAGVDPRIMCSPNAVPRKVHGCAMAIAHVLRATVKAHVAAAKKAVVAGQLVALVAPMVLRHHATANVANAVGSAALAALRAKARVHVAVSSVASAMIATIVGGVVKPVIAMTRTTMTIARLAPASMIGITSTMTTTTKRPDRPEKLSR